MRCDLYTQNNKVALSVLCFLFFGLLSSSYAKEEDDFVPDHVFKVTAANKSTDHPLHERGHATGFLIDGIQGKAIIVERGKKYAFDIDTGVKHDFYLSTSVKGRGVRVYRDGVKGQFTYKGRVKFTPTAATPDVLYYQCRNHLMMGGKIVVVNQGEQVADSALKIDTKELDGKRKTATSGSDQSADMARNKIQFAKILVSSSKMAKKIDLSDHEEAKSLKSKALQALKDAEAANSSGDFAKAIADSDTAMKLIGQAGKLLPKGPSGINYEIRYTELVDSVKTFTSAYERNYASFKKKGVEIKGELDKDKFDALVKRAKSLGDKKEYQEASRLLTKAQKMITQSLGQMMDDKTVVYDKNFETPKEEYEYELARFDSYLELIPIAKEQKRPSAGMIQLMDRFVDRATSIKGEALGFAKKGDYKTAIMALQGGTTHLQRALSIVGVR